MNIKLKAILPNGFSYDWGYQGPSLSMGRDPQCEMALDGDVNRQVSWLHARIECENGAARVRDFHSKNGTYVNDEKVAETSPIRVGDAIRLGRKGPKFVVLELTADPPKDKTSFVPAPPPLLSPSAPNDLAAGAGQSGPPSPLGQAGPAMPAPTDTVSSSVGSGAAKELYLAEGEEGKPPSPTVTIGDWRIPLWPLLGGVLLAVVGAIVGLLVVAWFRHAQIGKMPPSETVACDDDVVSDSDKATIIDVRANDLVPAGEHTTLRAPEKSSQGASLTVDPEGRIVYDPREAMKSLAPGETRTDDFEYSLETASNGVAKATVRVVVRGPILPPPPRPIEPEQLKSLYATAIVWLGGEREGMRLPLCTGWAATPTQVITTAWAIEELKASRKEGAQIIACSPGQGRGFIPVVDLAVHPQYDGNVRSKPSNVMVDVGVVTLKAPLAACCPYSSVKTLDLPSQKPKVTVVGFSIPYSPNPKPFDELSPPSLIWRTGRISGTQTYSNAVDNLPVLSMQLDAPDGFDGSPVFHSSGKVIGVLLRFGSDRYVVPTDRFAELLGIATTSPP